MSASSPPSAPRRSGCAAPRAVVASIRLATAVHEALAAGEGTVLARDTLAATLGEAAAAVRAELARFEALVSAVIDELARQALRRHDGRG